MQIDEQSFSAHKIVLASTIPYFHAMFTNDMVESRQQEIKMAGIEATYVKYIKQSYVEEFSINFLGHWKL